MYEEPAQADDEHLVRILSRREHGNHAVDLGYGVLIGGLECGLPRSEEQMHRAPGVQLHSVPGRLQKDRQTVGGYPSAHLDQAPLVSKLQPRCHPSWR